MFAVALSWATVPQFLPTHYSLLPPYPVGQFQLSFEDLDIPLSGVPVQLLRSYDSRRTAGKDFGPDWELGFRSVQVQAAEPVGQGWEDYLPPARHTLTLQYGNETGKLAARYGGLP